MKNSNINFKVQYFDTDAYKVAWHGSYLRWMEAGRVDFLFKNGIDINELDEKENIIMPVVEINIKYKNSAKLFDEVEVLTEAIEINDLYIIFEQTVLNKKTKEIFTKATVKGVCVQKGKLIRKLRSIINKGN